MKKFKMISIMAAIAVMCVASVIFVGCQDEMLEDSVIVNNGEQPWENELKATMADKSSDPLSKKGLRLVSYNVTNEQLPASSIGVNASDNTLTVFYNDKNDWNMFEIAPISKIQQAMPNKNIKEIYTQRKQKAINDISGDIKTVELTWNYKGQTITTQAIVSNKTQQVVYDDFLSNMSVLKVVPRAKNNGGRIIRIKGISPEQNTDSDPDSDSGSSSSSSSNSPDEIDGEIFENNQAILWYRFTFTWTKGNAPSETKTVAPLRNRATIEEEHSYISNVTSTTCMWSLGFVATVTARPYGYGYSLCLQLPKSPTD